MVLSRALLLLFEGADSSQESHYGSGYILLIGLMLYYRCEIIEFFEFKGGKGK